MEQRYPGIYRIDGHVLFPTQLVVTSQLPGERYSSLRILSNKAERKDVEAFIRETRKYLDSGDRERVDAVLQVSATANKELYREI